MVECLFLEQLKLGATWTSPSRTVTETDVVFFAGMTGDYDPLHTDHEFAAKSHYGKPIAHGLLEVILELIGRLLRHVCRNGSAAAC